MIHFTAPPNPTIEERQADAIAALLALDDAPETRENNKLASALIQSIVKAGPPRSPVSMRAMARLAIVPPSVV